MNLSSGQKIKVGTSSTNLEVKITGEINCEMDIACFGLDENRKLSDDRYMVFYNQKETPEKAICMNNGGNNSEEFKIDLRKLPNSIKYMVFTATVDGSENMSKMSNLKLTIKDDDKEICQFIVEGNDFKNEKAITILEIYFKDEWRINAIGKGFNGGLDSLLKDFGGEIAEEVKDTNNKKISLEKRMEKEAPGLVSLAKKAKVSLEKVGLGEHRAKVALCLDISASMSSFYRRGEVQSFAERILALATRFDDDGNIDVFLFGVNSHQYGECNITNYKELIPNILKKHCLEGGTYYHKAINTVRNYYLGDTNTGKEVIKEEIPVYVMFLTDGDTSSKGECEKEIKLSSYEPIFWSFMGIGGEKFSFLDKLDELSGRYVDNASLIIAKRPTEMDDEKLYDELVKEYKNWVKEVKNKGMIN